MIFILNIIDIKKSSLINTILSMHLVIRIYNLFIILIHYILQSLYKNRSIDNVCKCIPQ